MAMIWTEAQKKHTRKNHSIKVYISYPDLPCKECSYYTVYPSVGELKATITFFNSLKWLLFIF